MHTLDYWFLAGVLLFVSSALAHLGALWRPEGLAQRLAWRAQSLALIYWPLLLICWGLRFGEGGLNRLLLGSSAWTISGLYWLSLRRYPLETLGSVVSVISAVLGALAFLFTRPIQLSDDLNAWALYIHISLAILGITALSVSATMSVVYLWVERRFKAKQLRAQSGAKLPSLITLDQLSLKGLMVGFPLYTLALLVGTTQALKSREGSLHLSYIVATLAWAIYGGVLQARLTAGWRGRRAAWLTLLAFMGVLLVLLQYSVR
jgi:ABC-type uncharacterized transport system permease subunit